MRRGGALHEQCERDAQLVQVLISGTTCPRNCWPTTLSARRRHPHREPDPMRYRLFPARLGSICCEPFEGEIGSDKTNGSPVPLLADTTQRRRRGAAVN
jgi:hypothetical protein